MLYYHCGQSPVEEGMSFGKFQHGIVDCIPFVSDQEAFGNRGYFASDDDVTVKVDSSKLIDQDESQTVTDVVQCILGFLDLTLLP